MTPLVHAVQVGDRAGVRLLRNEPSRIQTTWVYPAGDLFRAVLNGGLETCRKLVDTGADPNVADRGCFSAVMGFQRLVTCPSWRLC